MRIKDAGRKSGGPSAAARGILLVAVIALAGAVALAITGGLGGAVADLGHSVGGLVGGITGQTASPGSSALTLPGGSPRLDVPVSAWTNSAAWDVRGLLPSGAAGSATLQLRIFVGADQVAQVPVPATVDFVVPAVPLQPGWNEISAAILGANGQGPRSAVIRINFDDQPPALKISAPRDKSTVTAEQATVSGTTQAASTIAVRNALTGGSANTLAAASGSFKVAIDVGDGTNVLSITATDPAGNATTQVVAVSRGASELAAKLALSEVKIAQSALPKRLVITLTVTDAGGVLVEGAKVDFSISPPGLPTETFTTVTAGGVAKWSVPIPKAGTTKDAGFVIARVVLLDGRIETASASFSVI
jgi:hypothetical protein